MSDFRTHVNEQSRSRPIPSEIVEGKVVRRDEIAWLTVIFVISLAMRFILAFRGGQYFWTDESRYCVSQSAVEQLMHGQFREAVVQLFGTADHLLFKVFGVVPAFVERITHGGSVVPALFYGCFSVVNFFLVWKLIRVNGGTPLTARYAVVVAALSNTFFYYTRHVFPYDLALTLILSGAWFGTHDRILSRVLSGVFVGLGFLTYNGYWLFGGLILILLSVADARKIGVRSIVYAVVCFLGLLLPIALVLLIGRAVGINLIVSYIEFSKTAIAGDFGIAWRFIAQYFWVSEHTLAVFWLVGAVMGLFFLYKRKAPPFLIFCVAGAYLYYFSIVALSDLTHHFTAYARHIRPMALFLCGLSGFLLEQLHRQNKRLAGAVLILLVGQAGFNMWVPFRQVFPPKFSARAAKVIEENVQKRSGLYKLLVEGYYDPELPGPIEVVLREPHPVEFRPYACDGYNELVRGEFLKRDIGLRVVRLLPENPEKRPQISPSVGPWAPCYGPLRIEVILGAIFPVPLVSTGNPGQGHLLFVQKIDEQTIQIGLDEWGGQAIIGRPIHCDLSARHVIVVSFPSLYPEESHPTFKAHPEWLLLRHLAFASFDDHVLFNSKCASFPSVAPSLFHNMIGFSTAVRDFDGRVISVSSVAAEDLQKALGPVIAPNKFGPIQIKVLMPAFSVRRSEPLVCSGVTGRGDLIYITYLNDHQVLFGHDVWGTGSTVSDPIDLNYTEPHQIEIDYGALYPKEETVNSDDRQRVGQTRTRIRVDGKMILDASSSFHSCDPNTVVIGQNPIGASTSGASFTGELLESRH